MSSRPAQATYNQTLSPKNNSASILLTLILHFLLSQLRFPHWWWLFFSFSFLTPFQLYYHLRNPIQVKSHHIPLPAAKVGYRKMCSHGNRCHLKFQTTTQSLLCTSLGHYPFFPAECFLLCPFLCYLQHVGLSPTQLPQCCTTSTLLCYLTKATAYSDTSSQTQAGPLLVLEAFFSHSSSRT